MGEIKPLTGLRFVAAFGVVAGHMTMTGPGTAGRMPFTGYPWMILFFCLSGFVLTWTYSGRVDTTGFLWARFARVYPLFAVVFAIEVLVNGISRYDVVNHALLLQAWTADNAFFSVSWSLSVELFFYACFPILAPVLHGMTMRRLLWVAVVAVALRLGIALAVQGQLVSYDWARVSPLSRLPDFVFGCAMARMALMGARPPGWLAVALVGVVGLFMLAPLPDAFVETPFLAPAGVLMLCLASRASLLGRILGSPAMLKLGTASFALYLIHPLIRQAAWSVFGFTLSPVEMLLAVGAAIGVSFVLYAVIEQPARTWLRSFRPTRTGLTRRLQPDAP